MIAQGEWSAQQIKDAIYARNGSQVVSFRYDVLRNGVKEGTVRAEGTVSLNRFADIHRTAQLALYDELDWLKNEVKPYMLIRMPASIVVTALQSWNDRDAMNLSWDETEAQFDTWDAWDAGITTTKEVPAGFAEFPLGVFILSSPGRSSDDNGLNTYNVSAYDRTVILREDSLTEPLFFPAGTGYISAVQAVLVSAGITSVLITDMVETVLKTDREFSVGTRKLAVINRLLGEINFRAIYCDEEGRFVIAKYTEPSASVIDFAYTNDELSIIGRPTTSELDFYNVPNVFLAVVSNPDLDRDYYSSFVNDNPASKLSTVQRGRRIVTDPPYQPESIASQEDLDAYIRRIAFRANQIYEKFDFKTGLNPLHGMGNSIQVHHPDVSGIFIESSWELPLSHDGEMTHRTRRLVSL